MNTLTLPKAVAGLVLVLALFVGAFVLPAHKPKPHHVSLGYVGSTAGLKLFSGAKGAVDVKRYSSEADARAAIDRREVYGAFVVDRGGRHLLIASAASNSVAQMLRIANDRYGLDATIEDVKPLVADDSRGTTINSLFLALIMVSSIAVVALGALALSTRRLLGGLAAFAALGGLVVIAFVGKDVGALPGSYVALSAVTALTLLAIALPIAGLQRLFGQIGAAAGGLFFVLLANPASGNASAPEMLPGFWRAIGQLMPPGAGGTGLRNTAYFGGNAIAEPLIVLSAYAVTGLALVLTADVLRRRRTQHLRVSTSTAESELRDAA